MNEPEIEVKEIRRQVKMLRWGRPCPKCGRGLGEYCVSVITRKRLSDIHVARLVGPWISEVGFPWDFGKLAQEVVTNE